MHKLNMQVFGKLCLENCCCQVCSIDPTNLLLTRLFWEGLANKITECTKVNIRFGIFLIHVFSKRPQFKHLKHKNLKHYYCRSALLMASEYFQCFEMQLISVSIFQSLKKILIYQLILLFSPLSFLCFSSDLTFLLFYEDLELFGFVEKYDFLLNYTTIYLLQTFVTTYRPLSHKLGPFISQVYKYISI